MHRAIEKEGRVGAAVFREFARKMIGVRSFFTMNQVSYKIIIFEKVCKK